MISRCTPINHVNYARDFLQTTNTSVCYQVDRSEPKCSNWQVWPNNVDPEQTAPGSTLFIILSLLLHFVKFLG